MNDEIELWSDPAESTLIGAVMRDADALTGILASLPGRDFYQLPRGVVWDACRALHAEGQPIDPVTVGRWLMAHDRWSASHLHGDVQHVVQHEMIHFGSDVSVAVAQRYAEQVAELARRRALIAAAVRLRQIAAERTGDPSAVLAEMRAELDALDDPQTRHKPGEYAEGPLGWDQLIDEFEAFHAPGARRPGIPTPWWELDQITGGLHGGRMYTFGGRPAAGKTTAALIVAMHAAAEANRQALVVSREMSRVDVTGRILARAAEVPVADINARNIADWHRAQIRDYVKQAGNVPITVDASPRSLSGIKALARAHHHRHGLDLLVVDYLQLIRTDNPGRTREQEVAEVSRQLKELALELDCVMVLPAQLNRGSVQRADPRPVMSDLRDCLSGDTLITRSDTGRRVPIRELAGQRNVPVWSLDEHLRLTSSVMAEVWATGEKPVRRLTLSSGRVITVTDNHPLLTVHSWVPAGSLTVGDHIAVARRPPEPAEPTRWPEHEIIMVAHLLGDGCVTREPAYYCSRDEANLQVVEDAARKFGTGTRRSPGRGVTYTHFPMNGNPGRGRTNPLYDWLRGLGMWGSASHEKRVPPAVHGFTDDDIRLFLHHLWATDGSVTVCKTRPSQVTVYYATTSRALAEDVQALLLRLGIGARIRAVRPKPGNRPGWTVHITSQADIRAFLTGVRVHGERGVRCQEALAAMRQCQANPNVDTIPADAWDYVRKAMRGHGVTTRALTAGLGTAYNGAALYRRGLSRERMSRVVGVVPDPYLVDLASSDVRWDRIVSAEPCGTVDTYDARVPGTHSFLANDVISHNSGQIEQDSDVVILLYRPLTAEGLPSAEIEFIVDKNRHGPTGQITRRWRGGYAEIG